MPRTGAGGLVFQPNRKLGEADASSLSLHVCRRGLRAGRGGILWSGARRRPDLRLARRSRLVVGGRPDPAPEQGEHAGHGRAGGFGKGTGPARCVTATTDGIRDSDGLDSPVYAYRWIRIDGSVETEVASGANT